MAPPNEQSVVTKETVLAEERGLKDMAYVSGDKGLCVVLWMMCK